MTTTTTTTRTLHLVDIENLAGDPRAATAAVLDALTDYLEIAGHRDGDHVVLAANPALMVRIAFDLPVACSAHAARGRNGADLLLLAHAEPAFVADRYDRLVIGSGDAAFTATARAVRSRGIPVVIVARLGSLSRRLGRQTGDIRAMTDPLTLAA